MMNQATIDMICGWIVDAGGDREHVARWMRDTLRVGGIKACRALVAEAEEKSAPLRPGHEVNA